MLMCDTYPKSKDKFKNYLTIPSFETNFTSFIIT